ncbi:MAG TPA: hypothetical protein VEX37_04530, partial [Thermomicrobiales bacterium]|nr:hypothetical protein [Thermomicrobiales bacterium]
MSGVIYLVQGEGKLVPMTEQSYDSEDVLQRLLADYPDLLGGEQMNASAPRRWLLLAREAGLPSEEAGADRWSVDHLFVDQDGVPTIIEVKRSTDSRIRREVIGQMLDYAANAVVYWPVERLRSRFESLCESGELDPEAAIVESLGVEGDIDEFWKLVQTNLQAGRVRLVFVADIIPPELRRVVEFLNAQMNPAEVLAVEVRQYAGQGQQALVPRVIGQTQQAVSQKASSGASRETRRWDEASFMAEVSARLGPDALATAHRILDWSKSRATHLKFGTGGSDGTFYPRIEYDGRLYTLFTVGTDDRIAIYFGSLKSLPQFADDDKRLELRDRLNRLDG